MKNTHGYTMIELMVVVAVISLTLTFGLPQLNAWFGGSRIVANVNALVAGINISRSEAIKRSDRVTICKSANADAGTPSCTTSGDWEQGWIVFVDSDSTIGQYNSASDGQLLLRQDGLEGSGTTVRTSDNLIANYISFTSRGVPKAAGGGAQSGLFRICDSSRRESNDGGLTHAGSGATLGRGIRLFASGKVELFKEKTLIGTCS